jgi:hypothetical protein
VPAGGTFGIHSPPSSVWCLKRADLRHDMRSLKVYALVAVGSPESWRNATSSSVGRTLPRAAARLKIPFAARADSEYRRFGVASKMSDNEHSTAALGNSEVSSVKYPPREAIPDVRQGAENDGKVSAVGRGEKPWNVFDHEPSWTKLICDSGELVEEARPVAFEPFASAGDREVLAGEAAAKEIRGVIALVSLALC